MNKFVKGNRFVFKYKGIDAHEIVCTTLDLESYLSDPLRNHPFSKNDLISLDENVDLYKISYIKPEGNLSKLSSWRKRNRGGKGYSFSKYATIDDIDYYLKNGYFVRVRGFSEIDNINVLIKDKISSLKNYIKYNSLDVAMTCDLTEQLKDLQDKLINI